MVCRFRQTSAKYRVRRGNMRLWPDLGRSCNGYSVLLPKVRRVLAWIALTRKDYAMKQTTIIVQTRSGSTDWPAYLSETPGLAVCRNVWPASGNFVQAPKWRIVHIDSGRKLPRCDDFATRKLAMVMAKELAEITDWELSEGELYRQSDGSYKVGESWWGPWREAEKRAGR